MFFYMNQELRWILYQICSEEFEFLVCFIFCSIAGQKFKMKETIVKIQITAVIFF